MSWVSHLKTNVMIVSVVLLEPLMALLCRYAKHQPRNTAVSVMQLSINVFPYSLAVSAVGSNLPGHGKDRKVN